MSENDTYYKCKNHPEKFGFIDLGIDAENRFPCRQCYDEILRERKKKLIQNNIKSKEK